MLTSFAIHHASNAEHIRMTVKLSTTPLLGSLTMTTWSISGACLQEPELLLQVLAMLNSSDALGQYHLQAAVKLSATAATAGAPSSSSSASAGAIPADSRKAVLKSYGEAAHHFGQVGRTCDFACARNHGANSCKAVLKRYGGVGAPCQSGVHHPSLSFCCCISVEHVSANC